MSVIITEDRIKKILSNREKMLNDINKKMVLLFREVSRSDMGVFMDELIAEKSIYCSVLRVKRLLRITYLTILQELLSCCVEIVTAGLKPEHAVM